MVLSTFLLKQGVCIFLDDIGSTTYLLILVLLMLSAFFSASETAFSAVTKPIKFVGTGEKMEAIKFRQNRPRNTIS